MENEFGFPPYFWQEYADLMLFSVFIEFFEGDEDLLKAFMKPNYSEDVEILVDCLKKKELSFDTYSKLKNTLMPFKNLFLRIKDELLNNYCPICFSKYGELTISFSFCCKAVSCAYCLQKNKNKCIICKENVFSAKLLFELDSDRNPICLNIFTDSSVTTTFRKLYYSINKPNSSAHKELFFEKIIKELLNTPKTADVPIKTFLTYEKIKNSILIGEKNGEYSLITGFCSSIRLTDTKIRSIACLKDICLVLEANRLRILHNTGKSEEIKIEGESSSLKVTNERVFLAVNSFIYEFVKGELIKINKNRFNISEDCDWSVVEEFFVAKKENYLVCCLENKQEIVIKGEIDAFCTANQTILVSSKGNIVEYSVSKEGKLNSNKLLSRNNGKIDKIVHSSNNILYFKEESDCLSFSSEKGVQLFKSNITDFWTQNTIFCFKDSKSALNIQKEVFPSKTLGNIDNFIGFTNPTDQNCMVTEPNIITRQSIRLHNIGLDSEEDSIYLSESDSEEPFYIFN